MSENTITNGVLLVAGLIIALLVGSFFYNSAHYRYRITVPDGKYSSNLYTNGYRKRGDCIYFIEGGYKDSTQVCGTYRIQKIN